MTELITIEKVCFNNTKLETEYYKCTFINCDFSKLKLYDITFEECEFKLCNFSLTKFANNLRDSKFMECKMTGADFTEISKFTPSLNFNKCHLAYASFIGIKIKNSSFNDCNLNEASFDSADLTSTVFDKCDLERATFYETNLHNTDLSTAYNYTINPNFNRLKKTIVSETGLRGLVAHLDISIVE